MATIHHTLASRSVATENGCMEWTLHRMKDGYGRIKICGQLKLAHRLSYELSVGPIPDGICVLHRCDNPPCVNPDHLFLGTRTDNSEDMVRKGRHRGAPGERNRKNKLTTEQVLSIRVDERQTRFIAGEYDIAKSLVRKIKRRILWKHLT
jgi:hypothetical protein